MQQIVPSRKQSGHSAEANRDADVTESNHKTASLQIKLQQMGIGSAVSKAFYWKDIGRICVVWANLWLYSLGTVLSSCLNTTRLSCLLSYDSLGSFGRSEV